MTGRPSGFAVIAAEGKDFPDAAAFAGWTENAYRFDLSRFSADLKVSVTADGLGKVVVSHDPENKVARVTGDMQGSEPGPGPIYSGPFVELDAGILKVSDGKESYTVDFSGNLPVYR